MDQARKFWNNRAEKFDTSEDAQSDHRKKKYDKIRSHVSDSDLVLDYGCATGSLSIEIAPKAKHLYGLDISEQMIDRAHIKALKHKLDNCTFKQGTIVNFPFEIENVNVCLAFYILHLVESPDLVLAEINRKLEEDGLLITESPMLGLKSSFLTRTLRFFTKLAGLPYLHRFKPEEITQLIHNAGFEIIESELSDYKVPGLYIVAKKVK